MRVSSVLFAVAAVTLVVSLLCIWFYPSIQDFTASNTMWNGISSFSSEFGAATIDSLDDLPDLPEEAALVAISYREYSDEELSRIKRFVDDGGTLLLMDDYGHGNTVLAYLGVGVRFTNKPLLDPLFCYKNQSMPQILDFTPQVKESGIDVITFNHATTLTNVEQGEAIAWSSSSSFLDTNENESWDPDEPKGPFAVGAEFRLGKGTLGIVSDPSIIINTMVGKDDNYGFVRYLSRYRDAQKEVLVDHSHLAEATLDISRTRLISAREVLSGPYALLGITAVIFVVVSIYTLKKGESIG